MEIVCGLERFVRARSRKDNNRHRSYYHVETKSEPKFERDGKESRLFARITAEVEHSEDLSLSMRVVQLGPP